MGKCSTCSVNSTNKNYRLIDTSTLNEILESTEKPIQFDSSEFEDLSKLLKYVKSKFVKRIEPVESVGQVEQVQPNTESSVIDIEKLNFSSNINITIKISNKRFIELESYNFNTKVNFYKNGNLLNIFMGNSNQGIPISFFGILYVENNQLKYKSSSEQFGTAEFEFGLDPNDQNQVTHILKYIPLDYNNSTFIQLISNINF